MWAEEVEDHINALNYDYNLVQRITIHIISFITDEVPIISNDQTGQYEIEAEHQCYKEIEQHVFRLVIIYD